MTRKEQGMVESSSYEGSERRHDNGFCDKKCDSHEDVKEGLKKMTAFKEEQIGKMSKCVTSIGILFIVFLTAMTVSSSSLIKSTKTAEASASFEKRFNVFERHSYKEHDKFTKAIVKVEVLGSKLDNLSEDIKEIKTLLKERL